MRIRIRLPTPPERVVEIERPVVQTVPESLLSYDNSLRLSVSSAGRKSLPWRSPFTGWLVGITVLASSIDSGDTFAITLKGRTLKENIFAVAGTAIAENFYEPIEAGDTLVLYYNSQGATVKNIDLTPRVQYKPSMNP